MIYLDMDGVLADFVQHTTDLGIPNNYQWFEPRETWTQETLEGERIKTAAMHSPGFWINIPLCPGAKQLWDFCEPYGRAVLTAKPQPDSPMLVDAEKLAWINKNLGEQPSDTFICCQRTEKQKYAPGHVLVDDDPRNCKAWEDAGGIAILHGARYERKGGSIVIIDHANVQETINQIKELAANGKL